VLQADNDWQFIEVWIARHESPRTRDNYRRHIGLFLAHVGKPLAEMRLSDLQGYLATKQAWAAATRALATATIKSLFSFAQDLGYVRFNVGKAVKLPAIKDALAERIMTEADAVRMIALEPNTRNRALLTLTYGAGLRISEVCGLRWRDMAEREGGVGQVTAFGKGGKTRMILLSANTWRTVSAIRNGGTSDDAVFPSREGGALDRAQVHRIVKAAAARAGLSTDVSAHWLRHAHASHSLERGAPIHLVQATLGHASVATTGRYLHARPTDSSARYLGV
jgi:site-specific recombinase XerD